MNTEWNPEGRKSYQKASEKDNEIALQDALEIYNRLIEKYPEMNVNNFDSIMNALIASFVLLMKNVRNDDQKPLIQMIYKCLMDHI